MPPYQRHVFICVNQRPPDDPRGCCSAKGSEQVRDAFKVGLKSRGLSRIVRANAAGCLDACALGISVVIYPEAVWYGGVTMGDVEEIIEKHVMDGKVVERLLMKPASLGLSALAPLDRSAERRSPADRGGPGGDAAP
jgi:(2Fe-2S) ferredoxin